MFRICYIDSFDAGGGATDMALLNVTISPRPVVAGKNFSLDLDLQNSNIEMFHHIRNPDFWCFSQSVCQSASQPASRGADKL